MQSPPMSRVGKSGKKTNNNTVQYVTFWEGSMQRVAHEEMGIREALQKRRYLS